MIKVLAGNILSWLAIGWVMAGCSLNLSLEDRPDVANMARTYTKQTADRPILERNAEILNQRRERRALPAMETPVGASSGVILEKEWTGERPPEAALPAGGGGPDKSAAGTAASGTAASGEETFKVAMEFQDESLLNLVKIIFGEYLKQPYSVLEDFKDKKVNFSFKGEVGRTAMLRIFETFLELHGVHVKFNEGVYAITMDRTVKSSPFRKRALGEVTEVFKLRYLLSSEFSLLVRQFVTAPDRMVELSRFNTLVVTAPKNQILALESMVTAMDVPFFEGKHVLVYVPRFLKAQLLEALLNHHHDQLSLGGQKGSNKSYDVKAMEGSNRVVIVADGRESADYVRELLASLDGPNAGSERKVFQYRLNTQTATELLTTVNPLVQSMTRGSTPPPELVADKGSNSLMVVATLREFAEIKRLIDRLDQAAPAAVHIEVTVAQVQLNENMQYGVEWYLKNKLGGHIMTDATMNTPRLSTPTLQLGAISLLENRYLALDLLAQETQFSVISNPQVTVRNGGTAKINVGQEIAIVKSTTTLEGAQTPTTKSEIQRTDVSMNLEVKPTIAVDGQITLFMKLEEKRPAGEDKGQPVFSKRDLTTDLIIHDGQTLLLGGLLERTKSSSANKVPWLGDLPVMGNLFRDGKQEENVKELIVLLTARLMVDARGASMVTKAILDAVPERLAVGHE